MIKFFLYLATAILWVDVFTYQGYLESLIHLPSKLIMIGVFALGALTIYLRKPRVKASSLPLIISATILALYCLIVAIEGSTAQGYIFAHLGLRPESMFIAVLAALWLLVALSTRTFWSGYPKLLIHRVY